jgi:hypothetical protein
MVCGYSLPSETLKRRRLVICQEILLGTLLGHLVHLPEGKGFNNTPTTQGLSGCQMTSTVPTIKNSRKENLESPARSPSETNFQALASSGQL